MTYDVCMLLDPAEKQRCARQVLESLTVWFANETSREDYIAKSADMPVWAAMEGDNYIGFFGGACHYGHTAEIVVCGVVPTCHGKGVGKAIWNQMKQYYIGLSCDTALVKTLSDEVNDPDYAGTIEFYKRIGFVPLITLHEMWDEENPCLIMTQPLMGEEQ